MDTLIKYYLLTCNLPHVLTILAGWFSDASELNGISAERARRLSAVAAALAELRNRYAEEFEEAAQVKRDANLFPLTPW